MNKETLKKHIYATYATLRHSLAAMAVFFPMLLYLGGRFHQVLPQNSMSAYYFASAPGLNDSPMRVWFVGLLFAIGACLIVYKGFSHLEDWLLNVAGISATCVALFPMPWECEPNCPQITIHGASASILFLCIATVSIFCAKDTIKLLKDKKREGAYLRKYRLIGALMAATPLVAFLFATWLGDLKKYVFAVEAVGIWTFSYYWWTKSRELAQTDAELAALSEELET